MTDTQNPKTITLERIHQLVQYLQADIGLHQLAAKVSPYFDQQRQIQACTDLLEILQSVSIALSTPPPARRFYGYGIMGKTEAYASESCVAEIPEALEEKLEYARDAEPEEDFRIVPLFGVMNWSDLCLSK